MFGKKESKQEEEVGFYTSKMKVGVDSATNDKIVIVEIPRELGGRITIDGLKILWTRQGTPTGILNDEHNLISV
jgi:hypothetical protein